MPFDVICRHKSYHLCGTCRSYSSKLPMSRWHRLAHFQSKAIVKVGDYVTPRTKIAKVGSTGHSTGPHVHHDGTWGKPTRFTQYRMGLSDSKLKNIYFDTEPWKHVVLPHKGLHLTNKHLKASHLGCDINVAPQDLGLDVYSPVYGRVQYVSGIIRVWSQNLRKFLDSNYNDGFGYFVWIEEDMSRPSIK